MIEKRKNLTNTEWNVDDGDDDDNKRKAATRRKALTKSIHGIKPDVLKKNDEWNCANWTRSSKNPVDIEESKEKKKLKMKLKQKPKKEMKERNKSCSILRVSIKQS